jgi:hypothetical protein
MSKCIMLTEMMMIITVIHCGDGAVITCFMVYYNFGLYL